MKDFSEIKEQMDVLEKIRNDYLGNGERFFEAFVQRVGMEDTDFGNGRVMPYLNDFAEGVSEKIRDYFKDHEDSSVIWTPSASIINSSYPECNSWIKILGDDVGVIRLKAYHGCSNADNCLNLSFLSYSGLQESIDAVSGILQTSFFELLYDKDNKHFGEKFSDLRERDKEKVIEHIYSLKTRNTKIDEWLSENHPDTVKKVLMNGIDGAVAGKKEV